MTSPSRTRAKVASVLAWRLLRLSRASAKSPRENVMSVALLCVQFRNLLPSEEVLRFARALWHDLQQRGELPASGDATLSIKQMASDVARFRVELRVQGSPLQARARDADVLLAVQDAFSQLRTWPKSLDVLSEPACLGKSAPARLHTSLPDTDLG